ncbi:MAG: hypothetical protein M1820_001066 [Bogoriella megaspora]|nr:MAG: hypothetical protein M1820_001066 [Bogoriella megaspora]
MSLPTLASIASAFADYLVVAIHSILYERDIYPQTSFLLAKKYGFAVRQNRHPRVCQWITDAVNAVEKEIIKGGSHGFGGTVARVVLVIFSPSSQPLERFVFDVSRFPDIPADDIEIPLERATKIPSDDELNAEAVAEAVTEADHDVVQSTYLINLEEQLRATMAKLITCSSSLSPLPPNCTYTLVLETKQDAQPPIDHPQLWMPVEPGLQAEKSPDGNNEDSENNGGRIDSTGKGPVSNVSDLKTVPIRAVKAGEVTFEVWVEEGRNKRDAVQEPRPDEN